MFSMSSKSCDSPECSRCLRKAKLQESRIDEQKNPLTSYANLPEVILLKIFSFLYIGDLCRAGRVCLRWYHVSRCQILWKFVDAQDMQLTSHQVQKFVPILPPCVTYMRICGLSTHQRIPFLTPRTANEMRERCPQLETLILESAFIAKHIHFTDITVEDLPQKLCTLSLRKSFFHTDQFFCSVSHPTVPKIQVLDCSACWCVTDNDVPIFSRLSDLQEIYLAGCPITDAGIVTMLKNCQGNLKVLDLEATAVGEQTISALNQYCKSLERLYVGNSSINDDDLLALEEGALPLLHTICLRKTEVTCTSIKSLIVALHGLHRVNVAKCGISINCTYELLITLPVRKSLIFEFEDAAEGEYCDHFLLRNVPEEDI